MADTSQHALFRAMLTEGWFTESDGDLSSPTGVFGYVVNQPADYPEVEGAFRDTIDSHGPVSVDDFHGVFYASVNAAGELFLNRIGDVGAPTMPTLGIPDTAAVRDARAHFAQQSGHFARWKASR